MPEFPRLPLCTLPTPLHHLNRVSEDLGTDIWIKRDDLTGFAGGGNKGRKLEFLMAAARAAEADVIVTNGACQSNFIRQLGAACSVFGIRCVAVVMPSPFDADFGIPEGQKLLATGGNVLLDDLFGVELREIPNAPWEVLWQIAEDTALELEKSGDKVFRVPVGGSSPTGALGFFEAVAELEQHFPTIITCSSSGSTQAGLRVGLEGTATRLIGIAVDPEEELFDDLARIATGLSNLLGRDKLYKPTDFEVRFDWVGGGYGVLSPEGHAAIRYLARREGILLDPVYSGKAFAGLRHLVRQNEVEGPVLFWHTGGVPSLFAMPD